MLKLFGDRKTINVRFFKTGETQPFAQSKVPIDQLPDTFAIDTTLTLQEEQWRVSHAEPLSKSEFRKTGRLSVYLSKDKVVKLDTNDIRFSVPSINNDLAGLVPAGSLEDVFVVHEDDWRQTELVSSRFRHDIDDEMKAIGAIIQSADGQIGYENVHVRSRIPSPFADVNVPHIELERQFGLKKRYAGVAFHSVAAVVEHGYAQTTDSDAVFWGQLSDTGNIAVLCVHFPREGQVNNEWVSQMDHFLQVNKLLFVDWNRMALLDGVHSKFSAR